MNVFCAVLFAAGLAGYSFLGDDAVPMPFGGSTTTPPEYSGGSMPWWLAMTLLIGMPQGPGVSFIYAPAVDISARK